MSNPADRAANRTELIPRATINEIVKCRDKALDLYAVAHTAIAAADAAIKAAHDMAHRASPTLRENSYTYAHEGEVAAFANAVNLPDRAGYLRTARRLTDIRVWAYIVERTELERLMDKQAKDELRKQMQFVPEGRGRRHRDDQGLITAEEAAQGMPEITVENIQATLERFRLDAGTIFQRGVANAFSKLDRRFKSHDGFKIGSRVILTRAFDGWGSWNYHSNERDTLMDIERAFCILDGRFVGETYATTIGAIDEQRRLGRGARQSLIETEYFKIRIFQNGNAHLWFLRDDLVEKVNKLLADYYGEVIGDSETQEPDPLDEIKTTPAKRYGFFPTPDAAVRAVMRDVPLWRAKDKPALTVLEPSAGTGNLARACVARDHDQVSRPEEYRWDVKVDCVEIQPELAAALDAEGIYRRVTCCDFLALQPDPGRLYDVIVMNPPHDRERDIDHVMHALKFLKPDGQLTAIMSAGTTLRETRKSQAFRELMTKMQAHFDDLPPGSFSESGTNVNTVILRVYKDGRQFWR